MAGIGFRFFLSSIANKELQLKGFSNAYIGINAGAAVGLVLVFALPFQKISGWICIISGLLTLLAAGLVQFGLLKEELTQEPLSLMKLWTIIRSGEWRQSHLGAAWRYLFLGFLGMFLYSQLNELVPVFFERSLGIPPYLGFVFALNAVMIVVLQRPMTRLFQSLQSFWKDSGLSLGFILFGVGSLVFTVWWVSVSNWVVVVLFTFAEMLIMPHLDYLLGQVTPITLRPYFFGLSITMSSLGRSLCAGLGIQFLGIVSPKGFGLSWWWVMTTFLAFGVGLQLFVKSRARKPFAAEAQGL